MVPPEAWGGRIQGQRCKQYGDGDVVRARRGEGGFPPFTKGSSRGLAKARSITERRTFPKRGNLVYTPGEFIRAKPPIAANSKYGAEAETSWDEKEHSGSARGLWMFRSPTTKRGTPVSGKRDSGGTEWTLRSAELIE